MFERDNFFSIDKKLSKKDFFYIINQEKEERYKKGHTIYMPSTNTEHIYFVKSGKIKMEMISIDGDSKTIFVFTKRDFFGENSSIFSHNSITTTTSIEDSVLVKISEKDLKDKLTKNPKIFWDIYNISMIKSHLLMNLLYINSPSKADSRIKIFLDWIFNEFGEKEDDIMKLKSSTFTHQEVGNILGCSRVYVSKVFTKLYQDKILVKKDGYYYLIGKLF